MDKKTLKIIKTENREYEKKYMTKAEINQEKMNIKNLKKTLKPYHQHLKKQKPEKRLKTIKYVAFADIIMNSKNLDDALYIINDLKKTIIELKRKEIIY